MMDMNRGYVIGGTHAGEFHSCAGDFLNIPTPLDIFDFRKVSAEIEPTSKTSYETYRHVKMQWRHTNGREWNYGFWVSVDEDSPQPFIIEEMLRAYIGEKKRK